MKLTRKRISYHAATTICKNCDHSFQGKICNQCGEKVFNEKTLTTKHFIHEAIDFFYHWESKVLKTIRLNFLKPGYVTKQNLEGIRVPYAKPVQLYLVVAFVFFVVVSKLQVSDYIPQYGDQDYYSLSAHAPFTWAKPVDRAVSDGIKNLWVKKGVEIESHISEENAQLKAGGYFSIPGRLHQDSIVLDERKMKVFTFRQAASIRQSLFNVKVGAYGKVFIFILIPVFALFFYLLFYKKIKYYGASLILATHFMVYNLCFYMLWSMLNVLPARVSAIPNNWMIKPFRLIFYNSYTGRLTDFLFGSPFEFIHLIFFSTWFYFCFKRLFNLPWWQNILASYFLSRIFFYLIFGVLKKFIIAFTVWSIHYT